ncbi:MAG: transketolase, partial [Oscillospiraceae bacterium]
MDKQQKKDLEIFATNIRIETIKALGYLGFGHVGGAFSVADLIAVLYGGVMKIDPKNPKWEDRDYLVCSKGHAGPVIYTTLAMKGFFPMEELLTINKPKTHLPSHCDRNLTTGIDMTTGSLGQGSSLAVGIACGNKLDKKDNYTYLIMGDGEIQEGQVWEAASFAAHRKLDNLITFVDWNKKQLDGYITEINDFTNIAERFEAFGWNAVTVNGHDVEAIWNAIDECKKVLDILDLYDGCNISEEKS